MSEPLPEVKKLLAELVAIDSTSARANGPIIDLLERRLAASGFRCERFRYVDDAGTEKVNLLAHKGEGRAELALVGHSDCVPYDASWKDALVLTERDGRLYGRGSCDTKAFLACAVVAAERARPEKGLLLVFTSDEEIGCLGAKKLAQARALSARYAIVGEPTSLRPIRANKGYCIAEVEVFGREGHSAYPDSGASAIYRAARFIKKLEDASLGLLRQERDGSFEPPFTTVNVGLVSGGRARNIIAGSCRFTVEWRPIPSQPVERVMELLEGIRAELTADDPGFWCEIRVVREDRGFCTPEGATLVRFLSEQSGRAPDTVAFGTEGPMMAELGAEPVVFGPGDIRVAHQTGEYVPVDEVARCVEVLSNAIAHFCGRG